MARYSGTSAEHGLSPTGTEQSQYQALRAWIFNHRVEKIKIEVYLGVAFKK